nr:hypothetical protein [Tanacetum cinerariifolium]
QKVFANMRRVGKGFSGVETPLFASMLVQPQPQVAEEKDDVEVPAAPTPPSPTNAPSPTPQDPLPTPPQAQPVTLPASPQEQPTDTSESSMTLLHILMETCTTLSQKVAQLEQVQTLILQTLHPNHHPNLTMAPLTFADTHNMVAYLSKSDASADFDQIFWATASIKRANDVVKLQALIDRKKVVVIEDVIRQDLRLDDADGVECLPNAELAPMGYEMPPPKLTFYKF